MGAAACRQGTLADTVLGKAKYNIKTLSEGIPKMWFKYTLFIWPLKWYYAQWVDQLGKLVELDSYSFPKLCHILFFVVWKYQTVVPSIKDWQLKNILGVGVHCKCFSCNFYIISVSKNQSTVECSFSKSILIVKKNFLTRVFKNSSF